MTNHWKPEPDSLAAVRVKDVGLADWPTILAADGRYSRIPPGFLMPLSVPSPEVQEVLNAVEGMHASIHKHGADHRESQFAIWRVLGARARQRAVALESIAPSDLPPEDPPELPGDMLSRMGDDAAKWAAEFCKTAAKLGHPGIDEGWMIGWFANAIEHSYAVRRWAAEKAAPSDLHTICDHAAKYDAGECCGREPCAEDARIAGLRDAVVAKAREIVPACREIPMRMDTALPLHLSNAIGNLSVALEELDAALSPPPPPDPVARMRNALSGLLGCINNAAWRDAAGLRLSDTIPAVADAVAALKEADNAQ